MSDRDFNAGDRAILMASGVFGPRRGRIVNVAKVYKNGNFVIEGYHGQWRQSGHKTGSSSAWSREYLRPYTDELWQELEAEQEAERICWSVNRVGEYLKRIRSGDEAARIWNELPESIRKLAEGDE